MLFYKGFQTSLRSVTPSASDLELINQFALEPLSPEQVFCGRMALCNDQYDRGHERLPSSYLNRFVDTGVGKSVMTGHNYREMPVGKFYDAEVRKTQGRLEYVPSYYMLADDPLVPKIKAGVVRFVSIGFYPDIRLCDICGKDYDGWWNDPSDDDPCSHLKGREYEVNGQKVMCRVTYGGDVEKVEKVEGSFVWLGQQYNAETIGKEAGREVDISAIAKASYFDLKGTKEVWALKGSELPHGWHERESRLALPGKETRMPDNDKTHEGAAAASDPKREAFVKAGERYRERMLKSIETRYAACGMEATGKAITASLGASEDFEALEKAEEDAKKVFDERHRPQGAGTPDSTGDRKAIEESLLAHSPMGQSEEDYL